MLIQRTHVYPIQLAQRLAYSSTEHSRLTDLLLARTTFSVTRPPSSSTGGMLSLLNLKNLMAVCLVVTYLCKKERPLLTPRAPPTRFSTVAQSNLLSHLPKELLFIDVCLTATTQLSQTSKASRLSSSMRRSLVIGSEELLLTVSPILVLILLTCTLATRLQLVPMRVLTTSSQATSASKQALSSRHLQYLS